MTGKSILEALSFVDERYIEEAENEKIHTRKPLRYLLPLAACVCLILAGFRFMTPPPETAEPHDTQIMQEPADESNLEIQEIPKENSIVAESDIMLDAPEVPKETETPSVILKIEAWTEEGFTAVVAGTVDTDVFPVGTVLDVQMLPNTVMEAVEGDIISAKRSMPMETDYPVGTLVRVMVRSYSEEENVLKIDTIRKEE